MNKWYTMTKADALQGQIAEESTGKTIAVSYDPKDAVLIASAPDLLAALQKSEKYIIQLCKMVNHLAGERKVIEGDFTEPARDAIAKANS